MLVATFAVAFLLQSVALLIDVRDDTLGEPAASLAHAQPAGEVVFGIDVRKITVVAIVTAAVCLLALVLLLGRTRSACRCAPRPWTSGRRGCSASVRTA